MLVIVCTGYLTINGNFKKMKLEGEIKSLVNVTKISVEDGEKGNNWDKCVLLSEQKFLENA